MTDITLHEVGPRDGLQNEPGVISVADKVAFINALSAAGLHELEVGSFVSPKWVPQMAGTADVLAALPAGPNYAVLVPNMRGWDGFQAATKQGAYAISIFVSATEGFSRANLNCTISESLERLKPVVAAAADAGVPVRGYISCVTDCPFDGQTSPAAVAKVAEDLRQIAPMPLSLGDTIGKGTPDRVAAMLRAVLDVAPADQLAGHFHDTSGQALDNISTSLETGLRAFDSAAGGLGGCPYAPGAPGNVATESVVAMLHDRGYSTGVDTAKLEAATAIARKLKEDRS